MILPINLHDESGPTSPKLLRHGDIHSAMALWLRVGTKVP